MSATFDHFTANRFGADADAACAAAGAGVRADRGRARPGAVRGGVAPGGGDPGPLAAHAGAGRAVRHAAGAARFSDRPCEEYRACMSIFEPISWMEETFRQAGTALYRPCVAGAQVRPLDRIATPKNMAAPCSKAPALGLPSMAGKGLCGWRPCAPFDSRAAALGAGQLLAAKSCPVLWLHESNTRRCKVVSGALVAQHNVLRCAALPA